MIENIYSNEMEISVMLDFLKELAIFQPEDIVMDSLEEIPDAALVLDTISKLVTKLTNIQKTMKDQLIEVHKTFGVNKSGVLLPDGSRKTSLSYGVTGVKIKQGVTFEDLENTGLKIVDREPRLIQCTNAILKNACLQGELDEFLNFEVSELLKIVNA